MANYRSYSVKEHKDENTFSSSGITAGCQAYLSPTFASLNSTSESKHVDTGTNTDILILSNNGKPTLPSQMNQTRFSIQSWFRRKSHGSMWLSPLNPLPPRFFPHPSSQIVWNPLQMQVMDSVPSQLVDWFQFVSRSAERLVWSKRWRPRVGV